ncbi:MAG: type II toxin-antitoxin system HicA family toxin [Chloroflexi bacterium]|nr:type II toxin-antitoxin system HicA family toxin [Chloroflexota bacterium]MYE42175.1 type II toxin-antitoxin system HicA family toxin [Chloroflexota bacterium]
MPAFGPISRRDLIAYLREIGFDGPYTRSGHPYMAKDKIKVTIPNPHRRDISRGLLATILREAGISRADWEHL